jgi:hypothetical protein
VVRPRDHTRKRFNLTSRRLREIENLIRYRNFSNGRACMPAKEGEDYLSTVARHLRRLREDSGKSTEQSKLREILSFWASKWLPANVFDFPDSLDRAVETALRYPKTEKALVLGSKLKLTDAERKYLKITTIAPHDVTPAEREARNRRRKRETDRLRAREKRKALGVKSRAEYLANSLTAKAPWVEKGVSRRTWERQRKRDG